MCVYVLVRMCVGTCVRMCLCVSLSVGMGRGMKMNRHVCQSVYVAKCPRVRVGGTELKIGKYSCVNISVCACECVLCLRICVKKEPERKLA